MKKQVLNILAIALTVLTFSACTQDALEPTPNGGATATKPQGKQITLKFQAEDPVTKTQYSDNGLDSQYEIYWSEGDAIGIYGVNGHEYPNKQYNLEQGAGQKTGSFGNDAVTWIANTATDQNPYRFYAYYPYDPKANANVTTLAHTKVAMRIPGVQVQDGPNNIKHVGKYRYTVATKLGKNNEGVLLLEDHGADLLSGLSFKNVTSAFKFSAKNLPAGVKVTSVTLASLQEGIAFGIEKGTMDLSKVEAGVEEVLTVEESSSFLTLDIENGGLGNGEFGFLVVNPQVKGVPYEITYTLSDGRTFKRLNSKGKTQHTAPATGFDPGFRYVAELDYNNSEEVVDYEESLQTSNCYMVQPNTYYKFDARFKGNSTTQSIGAGVKAEAIWNTGELGSINYKDGFVTFKSGKKASNALIAVKDASGNILWSWHIWVTPLDKSNDVTVKDYGTFMSLNLGALSATDELGGENQGLYYQWGRKDPMFAQDYTPDFSANPGFRGNDDGSIVYDKDYENAANLLAKSIANPTTYYQYWTGSEAPTSKTVTTQEWEWNWYVGRKDRIDSNIGNTDYGYYETKTTTTPSLDASWGYTGEKEATKTIYDPCPVGYRVPTSEELAFLTMQNNLSCKGLNFAITGLLDNDIFIYSSGYAKNNVSEVEPGEFIYEGGIKAKRTTYTSQACYLWTASTVKGINSGAVNVIMTDGQTYHKSNTFSTEYLKSCGRAIPVRCIAE